MPSQYKQTHGVKYERDLLEIADAARGANRIMLKADAELLWRQAMDGNRVTATEERTLQYIMSHYRMNAAATKVLRVRIAEYHQMRQSKLQKQGKFNQEASTPSTPRTPPTPSMPCTRAANESYMGVVMNLQCILSALNSFVKLCVRLASALRV